MGIDISKYDPYTYPHPLRGEAAASITLGVGGTITLGSGGTIVLQ